ncbi:saccharopine dehydrogenase family protein [Streptosporangium amethystogenes]|uniref:saccharopine dehydrogenase family protein n=1 Tax=Streptosporangium amethystogenes TaxID=2002 RepID=UPI0004C7063D|nr:saccharopine dehydrogenase NADP-binding domain-containing protein [Streptosporangium amethystogenes]
MPDDRPYDIVLFGATGFTGALTAEYLARNAGPTLRWALAGRNRAKLETVRNRIGLPELPLLHADVTDPASLVEIARQARVVATTVGPYVSYGEPLVAACADAGTHYADITGEPEFVDRMFIRHHERAVRTGAKLVHACGFDSVPHDLGAYFTVGQLPEGVPLEVSGFVRASGAASGGTAHSAVTAISRFRQTAEAAHVRRELEIVSGTAAPSTRRARGMPGSVRYVGGWALPLPTLDPQIVARSARALERYGPDFTYRHHLAVRQLPVALGLAAGVGALALLAQIPPARSLLLRRFAPGEGPGAEQRARSWFKVTFLGLGGGARVVTEVAGGDPGYGETAKMLGESALCLATDDLPEVSGQLTTAVAMGDALIGRLVRAGITFTVLSDSRK